MIKIQIDDLMAELSLGEYGDRLVDYNSGIIQEVMYEIAGGPYTSDYDLWNWARDNQDIIEDSIMEFGIDTNNLNLTGIFQSAYTYKLENELLSDVKHIVRYWIYHNLPVDELSEDMVDYIEDYSNTIDTNKRLDWIMEEVLDYMEVYHNDELK